MENQTKKIKIEDFKIIRNPDRVKSDCFHFQVRNPEFKLAGYGSSYNEKLALKIAVCECIERQLFCLNRESLKARSTSGFAVHRTLEEAQEAAICEALERDALLTHWLLKIRPQWIDLNNISGHLQERVLDFNAKGFDLAFGILSKSNDRYCLVGALSTDLGKGQKGYTFSSSCNKNIEGAVGSILLELRRSASIILNKKDMNLPLFDPQYVKNNGHRHLQQYLSPVNAEKLDWFLNRKPREYPEYTFPVRVLPLLVPFELPWSLYGAYAFSSHLQSFYFGTPQFRKINRQRLKVGWSMGKKLNKELHILP